MSIRDKARKAQGTKPDAKRKPDTPAVAGPKPSTDEPKAVAVKDKPEAAPSPEPEKVATVTNIADHVVESLDDDEVERFLAKAASGPLVAGLAATRETKRNELQYDGKTEDGFVVRVWAPEGAPMIVKARLEVAE